MPELSFTGDPSAFLAEAGGFLAAQPVLSTVVAVVTDRAVAEELAGVPPHPEAPRWWVVTRDERGMVTGAGMRTATAPPYPPYLLQMPREAARELGRALAERGERVDRINGVLESAVPCAEAIAELTGRVARVAEHSRLFECTEVVTPSAPPGRLRHATEAEAPLCLAWFAGFMAAANEQAGKPADARTEVVFHDLDDILRRIRAGTVYLWENETGQVVHLSAVNGPSFGVSRIGPVFTPKEHRGRGYASAALAQLTAQILETGARACLFTDQANPTSNAIYQALGYQRVSDTGEVEIE